MCNCVYLYTLLALLLIHTSSGQKLICTGELSHLTHSDCERKVIEDACFFVPHFAQFKSCAVICHNIEVKTTAYERCQAYCPDFVTANCRITTAETSSVASPVTASVTSKKFIVTTSTSNEMRNAFGNLNVNSHVSGSFTLIALLVAVAILIIIIVMVLALVVCLAQRRKLKRRSISSNKTIFPPSQLNRGVEETGAEYMSVESLLKPHQPLYTAVYTAEEGGKEEKMENLLNDERKLYQV